MTSELKQGKLAILMGGGPAPGINGVIHSATIEAITNGLEVLGIYDGFKHLIDGKVLSRALTIDDVSRIYHVGGCILRTSRANPTRDDKLLDNCVRALVDAEVTCLLAIGGDDTAYSAYRVSQHARDSMGANISTVHVPKTIDNDLPLPAGIPTFGFETAREVGTRIVMNLMKEAVTGLRWFLVVAMGRQAGHLALGIGKSAGATLTLIPEEWQGREIRLQEVVDILTTSVIMRLARDRPYGVAVVAEGVIEQMSSQDLEMLEDVERDSHGHIRLSEINFSEILRKAWRRGLQDVGIDIRVIKKDLGYELRCADPVAFDIDYTRSLGEAAVEFLLGGGSHATITLQQGQIVPIPFDEMMDPETGRTEVRNVNVDSYTYRSAQKFMIRLKSEHAHDNLLLDRMAAHTNLSTEAFRERFGYLLGIAPRPF